MFFFFFFLNYILQKHVTSVTVMPWGHKENCFYIIGHITETFIGNISFLDVGLCVSMVSLKLKNCVQQSSGHIHCANGRQSVLIGTHRWRQQSHPCQVLCIINNQTAKATLPTFSYLHLCKYSTLNALTVLISFIVISFTTCKGKYLFLTPPWVSLQSRQFQASQEAAFRYATLF